MAFLYAVLGGGIQLRATVDQAHILVAEHGDCWVLADRGCDADSERDSFVQGPLAIRVRGALGFTYYRVEWNSNLRNQNDSQYPA